MSVLKPNRNETDFKVVSFAIEVRREITTYVIRDFAVEGIYIIHESKEYLRETLNEIRLMAAELGLHINDRKTQIYRIDRPFHFLQNVYYLTDSGRVVEKINKKRLTRMRRKLKKLAAMVYSGEREIDDIENMYRSWMGAYKRIMSKRQIDSMNRLYSDLFGGLNNG